MDLLSFLEEVISFERKSGRMIRERYYTNASIALDIYMTAQEDLSNPDVLRRRLQERIQVGKWWKTLSKPSPLLVLMYSEAADSIINKSKGASALILRLTASNIMKECPYELLSFPTPLRHFCLG